jgi:hypothetical protein
VNDRAGFQIKVTGADGVDYFQASSLSLIAKKLDQFGERKIVKFSSECHWVPLVRREPRTADRQLAIEAV